MTREEAADILDRFAEGKRMGSAEWDDFISITQKDPLIEAITNECGAMPEKYPAAKHGGYCNAQGIARMRVLRTMLYSGEYIPESETTEQELASDEVVVQMEFNHDYEVESLGWSHESSPHANYVHYPEIAATEGKEVLTIFIKPRNGEPWTGVFAAGRGGISGIYACPDSEQLCVIARGNAYLINVIVPKKFSVHNWIVNQAYSLIDQSRLIIIHTDGLCALDEDGISWCTDINRPVVEKTDDGRIAGTYEDCGQVVSMLIDLETGNALYLGKVNWDSINKSREAYSRVALWVATFVMFILVNAYSSNASPIWMGILRSTCLCLAAVAFERTMKFLWALASENKKFTSISELKRTIYWWFATISFVVISVSLIMGWFTFK